MRVIVGVGGGIAAYKSVTLVRELQRGGAEVRVVMTSSATRFVGAMTFTGITGHPAIFDLWDPAYPGEVHVELGAWADRMVIAPATMNLMARATSGMADDAVLATWACVSGGRLMAPAMHSAMWSSPATQRNVRVLEGEGVMFIGPTEGSLASGESGIGRMSEPEEIAAVVLQGSADLAGLRVVVTAGPTREALDPVRFLTNHSSGKMGYALAAAAAARGAEVFLVSGPTSLSCPRGVERQTVQSAREMHAAVISSAREADAIIMAAAVADYRPTQEHSSKIKKSDGMMTLSLERNPDILSELGAARSGPTPYLIGFALETEDLVTHARAKLERKRVDLVVANHAAIGFGGDTNEVTLVTTDTADALGQLSKRAVAERILDHLRDHRTGTA